MLSGVVRGSFNCPYCLIITSTGVICAAKCTCTPILLHITRDYLTWEKIRVEAQGHGSFHMQAMKNVDAEVLGHIFASSWSSHKELGVVQITFGVINNIFLLKSLTSSKCMRTALYVLTSKLNFSVLLDVHKVPLSL